ncbi:MAG: SDR family oxidoreductase [Oscillospiraceae bacterium]|nr:SDR family oxidoreductase [Oscillospiraceae bacterium]
MIPFINNMKDAFDLKGKSAIVTGGNGGIGLGIAKALAQCGVDVAILCRNMDKGRAALDELKVYGGTYKAYPCDICNLQSVMAAAQSAFEDFGGIEILVNNSGVAGGGKFLDMDPDFSAWNVVIDTDLTGMAHVTYAVGRLMRDAGKGGSIINITSNAGAIVNKGVEISPYAVAKAGANHFTRCMAVELGEYNIRVNAIAPGFTRAGFGADPHPLMLKLVEDQQPLKRMGEAIEIGALTVFLASPAAAHITGEVMTIDGGYTLSC